MPPETQYQQTTDSRAGQRAGRLSAADLQTGRPPVGGGPTDGPESVGVNEAQAER